MGAALKKECAITSKSVQKTQAIQLRDTEGNVIGELPWTNKQENGIDYILYDDDFRN